MAVIQELSPHLADLIAAGEVVERPASVAKELVENAIDAGASKITVEIQNGGISFLRITDNGSGIAPEDTATAFRRHATSKLRTEEDLAAIGTLGFRGEALAAIAAVSRIDLLTKQSGALAGTHLKLEGSKLIAQEEAGCPEGTTIIIRDLFFNTPARMKFLKKDYTEAGYVFGVVQHAALSHPEIGFTMLRDGKQVFSSAGDSKLMTPVFGVFGRELTECMAEIPLFEREALRVWGYITKPHMARPNRTMQHFFVNGRYVKNRTMQAAFEEAYRNRMISGKYPSCALFLTLPFHAVDVNVHPAKTEIKFAQEKQVFEAVYIACKNALESSDNIPVLTQKKPALKEDNLTDQQQRFSLAASTAASVQMQPASITATEKPSVTTPSPSIVSSTWREPCVECDDFDDERVHKTVLRQPPLTILSKAAAAQPVLSPKQVDKKSCGSDSDINVSATHDVTLNTPHKEDNVVSKPEHDSNVRVLGEAFHMYIIAEDTEGLLLIDKHAAHERMIFNKLRQSTEIPQQQVLTPIVVELTPVEAAAIYEHIGEVRATGFDIEPFGNGSFAVRGTPAYLDCADTAAVLSEIAEKLISSRAPVSERFDDLIHMVSCKAAIKAGSHSSLQELQNVCERVLSDAEVMACPHGRPVTVRLTKYELDKLFKRVNQ